MSIAEKFEIIADAVYEKGLADGKAEGGNTEEVYNQGVTDGRQAEREEFWDGFFKSKFWYGRFSGGGWNVDTFKPIYPQEKITPSGASHQTSVERMFWKFGMEPTYQMPIVDLAEFCSHFDFSQVTNADDMFWDARAKNINIDLSSCTKLLSTFRGGNGGSLDNITLTVSELCTNFGNAFLAQTSLKNITFTDNSVIAASIKFAQSPLNKQSIISVINALSSTASGQTLTLKKTAVQSAFGTNYDSSTEWTTLKNSKSNWTISLS